MRPASDPARLGQRKGTTPRRSIFAPVSDARSRMSRQLNVQQQNALVKEEILDAARTYISKSPYTRWVSEVLLRSGLHPAQGILVRLGAELEQGGEWAYATWLTSDGRFYNIEAMIEYGTHHLLYVEKIEDASSEIVVSEHQRGTGRSFGAIALEVLKAHGPGQ